MRLLTSPLRRMLSGLLNCCEREGGRPSKCCSLNPHHLLPRQNFSAKPTAAELVRYWHGVFEANRIPEAQESSEYIISYVLGAKTIHSLSASSLSNPLTSEQQQQVQWLSMKRLQRMPVQYVLGEWDFRELTLKMRPPVFIPRPETEDLVSLVLQKSQRSGSPAVNAGHRCPTAIPHPVILEIGCGSGAIALSLLNKLPQSRVIAVDKEEAAVNLTCENAQRLQLQDRIRILHYDACSGSWEQLLPWGPVDTIVSNPPYVFHEDMAHLAEEILSYEDLDALDGGNDGMRVIKKILALAPFILKDLGVFLEVDPRHPEMVENWLQSHPELSLSISATHKDFCGKPRFLHIQKHKAGDSSNKKDFACPSVHLP
ncbi:MTRF1L release factor glutamine methyltransferase isoform X2 [Pelodiscus sinensis]|uniref:MTRF1L release factor glutamine methyltransferase isoform X2 n=1 Tax=Pelodiscus sinensis TaxID=13735 RepID=UPI0003C4585D|nr:hemK methyltransferase family member 1 isoform X2 [Pelodiscus sinensis]|eukprot:XP_025042790.1 hemK methyltransferase family member 1 isoform X2 [Pelodiscus sinensis]